MGWIEYGLLLIAVLLFASALLPKLRLYRSLLWASSALMTLSALFPRPGSTLTAPLFTASSGAPRFPSEVFGIVWWILGAWIARSVLELILRRTIFPDDNRPHARRLFADLAAGLIYVVALVGIMDTVFKQSVSAVLATSGVLAVVLGLALQNTLADVFSGLALNIERPFSAGDWITIQGGAAGVVMEINWRATRLKTLSNEMVVIPNSIVAKAVVTNHRRLDNAHIYSIRLQIDHRVPAAQVIEAILAAARASAGIAADSASTVFAHEFVDGLITYEISVGIDDYLAVDAVRSELIGRVAAALVTHDILIGAPATEVRLLAHTSADKPSD
ncbi:MAG: mechanosensitive ion channel family protein [Steroidobacteraceae bacterium]|jgi:small-conductance mechanosensitive channel